ncbi:MAG TPA: TonB-dependent receptor [Pyrinomonadaceae bacterium]|nr:TonB-dependent receptor [Pyrinomonadaceae bacterium]
MRAFPLRPSTVLTRLLASAALAFSLAASAFGQAQSNAADLQGYVRDPNAAVVAGATVTARNKATGIERSAQTNDDGFYKIVNLPPGEYEVTVEAANFSRANVPSVVLTVGQRADLDVPLQAGQVTEVVTVSGATTEIVETSRTAVANTIEQTRIENLPVNQRDYLGIATTISTVNRGNDRPIGPAPSSGLNVGGQRGRSTLVQVDGADNTDNSINAARSTVSQEAVQEFQVVTNSYAPEFGRATGGIVNVVTKGGTNELRGNIFGFLRHKTIQARNPFAPVIDNDPEKKPPYTRVQYGATLGGPLDRDRTFFFTAFEQRRRQESAFFTSNVLGQGAQFLGSSVALGPGTALPVLPFPATLTNLTAAQAAFIQQQIATGAATGNTALIQSVIGYAFLASAGGQTALNGLSTLISPGGAFGVPAGQVVGQRFIASGAPVPVNTLDVNGNPSAFRPLNQIARIFPISEDTTFFSTRLDHLINDSNQFTMRFGYNPSEIDGIQDESQNQSLGQNDFSRTGRQVLRDTSFVASLNSTLSSSVVNEARFNFGRRRALFVSQGAGVAIQIAGTAFLGPNPFSPVDRTETRYQFTDNVNVVAGNHTFKFGADVNSVNVVARFELNFPGLYNVSETGTAVLTQFFPALPTNAPSLTPTQSYGAGLPSAYIQGFGNPNSSIRNRPLAFFAQDSWKMRPNLTFNYGVRYDVELTDEIPTVGFQDPLTGITLSPADLQAAQDFMNVRQGFPRDKNNLAPRVGVAWDPGNDGKTVIRAAYGLFYDHPLLAIAFNSDIADAAQQQQYTNVLPGIPDPRERFNIYQAFQGTVCSAATVSPICPPGLNTPGVAPSAQYLFGQMRFANTFPGFGPILPFTLHVSKDFEYAYAHQANLTVERRLTKDMSVSASYIFVGARHLPHPQDINAPVIPNLVENFRRFANRAPASTTEAFLFSVPTASSALYTVIIPGLVARSNFPGGGVFISPLAANFFRPSAPNYFFVASATGGAVTKQVFDAAIAGSVRTPGPISPFGDLSAQVSDANSSYNAMNLEAKRRFSNNFQFLASYTWSHAIDESSDLQTLLKPQNNRNRRLDRADSLFDQRHRFVFSGVMASPGAWRSSDSGLRRFLSDFTVAPILEISSGRPFNIVTGLDRNGDQQGSNERPSVAADGTLVLPDFFTDGSLARNSGITHSYASLDLRLTRAVRFGERVRLDLIAEGFNLFNRFNEASASPFFTDVNAFGQRASNGRYHSRPTASFDPRQFQFGLKLNF